MSSKKEHFLPALSFHFLTPLYDPVVAVTTREKTFKGELVRQADLRSGQAVLDLACGTATLTIALKKSCSEAKIYGLDGDPEILRLARLKIEKEGIDITLDQGFSDKMPYPDSSFDSVVSSLFFHHLTRESKQNTLREIYRVLKPGGALHIADWGLPANVLMKLASLPIRWLDGATVRDSFRGKLPEMIKAAGFTGVSETAKFNSLFGTIRLHKAGRK